MRQSVHYILTGLFGITFLTNLNAQVSSKRQKISFDENWKFHLGNAANPDSDFNYRTVAIYSKSGKVEGTAIDPQFNDYDWRTIQLPHDWAVELPFSYSKNVDVLNHGYKPIGALFPQNSIGWYRKHFSVSRADSGQRCAIQFDGVFRDSKIWVNGFYLGTNESGYLGANYDITDYLHYDKDNVITVRADASQFEGWFYEGAGIYRHAWLNKFANVHIIYDGIFVYTKTESGRAMVSIETTIRNDGLKAGSYTVAVSVADQAGRLISRTRPQMVYLKVNQEITVKQKLQIVAPRLWSIDHPYLYKAAPVIRHGNTVLDTKTLKFGIRTIVVDAVNGISLNGQSIKIKGVNCHPDHAGLGTALPDYLQYYRIQALKEMGANAYRTSHYAPTPELLDACDSLGMLVLDEQRLLNSSKEYIGQFEHLIKRDRSHASVFMWSIGNEEAYIQTNSIGKRLAQALLAKQVELDPTRTSTYAADLGNVFTGINEVIPVRGFNYRQFAVAAYHKDHPLQPLIGTEMGSTVTTRGIYDKDTINAYLPDEDITAPWWASRAEAWWPIAAGNKWFTGGFIWTGFDYRGEPTPFEWPNINSHFGVMDMCGFPKNIYYYYQSWWTDKEVLHVSPHWNWRGKEGKPVTVWVNTNAAEAELFLNGKSLGKKTMPENGHLQWSVPYAPGILLAVAYKHNKMFTAKVETTGVPARVIITPSKTRLFSDHRDAVILNISTLDDQGREVPDADNTMRFFIKGDAKIIGVGNGDPSSHEPDKCADNKWKRKLFNGKCQVILQSGTTKGTIEFRAISENLLPDSVQITLVK